ncbi:NUDIX domain-containing protein [Nostocoides vanveenii]|uniref:Nudix hydrolase domain-containing protein n=1 Tax=Nostocoides vanveenii TaxID=330835 RepID=A0ABP4X3I7_9MICO
MPDPSDPASRATHQRPAADLSTDQGRTDFTAILNERLPTKRVIAQGLLRNERDEVLLCQLTYKNEWDLPGGVVDKFESPATCVERECREELGVDLPVTGLVTTTWLPPYRGWDDAVLFLFDLGRVDADWVDRLTLQPREIVAVHWTDPSVVAERTAPYAARLIAACVARDTPPYLENSAPRQGVVGPAL